LEVEEVDDAPVQEAVAAAHDAVGQVADCATEDERERQQLPSIGRDTTDLHKDDHHGYRHEPEEGPEAAAQTERRSGVLDQVQSERTDQMDIAVVENARRPPLGQVIDDDNARGHREQATE
jgi:hypothetical protein